MSDIYVSGVKLTGEQAHALRELFEENDPADFDVDPDDFGFHVIKAVYDALPATVT